MLGGCKKNLFNKIVFYNGKSCNLLNSVAWSSITDPQIMIIFIIISLWLMMKSIRVYQIYYIYAKSLKCHIPQGWYHCEFVICINFAEYVIKSFGTYMISLVHPRSPYWHCIYYITISFLPFLFIWFCQIISGGPKSYLLLPNSLDYLFIQSVSYWIKAREKDRLKPGNLKWQLTIVGKIEIWKLYTRYI